jgi:peroxiredoxin
MVKTASTMRALGERAPSFSLPNVDGKTVALQDFSGKHGLLVIFMCNHCPFVIHLRSALAQFAKEYQAKGLAVVGINSNDITTHPDDSPEHMQAEAKSAGYTFPYLFDETQEIAQAYVRRPASARLSRPIRRQPAGQQQADHRRRSACGL